MSAPFWLVTHKSLGLLPLIDVSPEPGKLFAVVQAPAAYRRMSPSAVVTQAALPSAATPLRGWPGVGVAKEDQVAPSQWSSAPVHAAQTSFDVPAASA